MGQAYTDKQGRRVEVRQNPDNPLQWAIYCEYKTKGWQPICMFAPLRQIAQLALNDVAREKDWTPVD